MKTKITTIALIAILSVLPVTAQESYLPVFGEGVTRFYTYYWASDTEQFSYVEYVPVEGQINLFENIKDGYSFEYILVSEDNSKLWGYNGNEPERVFLLMDLNLNIGDIWSVPGYGDHPVTKVYYENERKIIEMGEYGYDELKFIEGVGPDVVFLVSTKGASHAPKLRAQYRDGLEEYTVPEWKEQATIIGSCSYPDVYPPIPPLCFFETRVNELKNELPGLYLQPSVVETIAQLHFPKGYSNTVFYLTVSTSEGKPVIIKSVSTNPVELDMRPYPAGVYLLCVTGNDISKTIKFVKK